MLLRWLPLLAATLAQVAQSMRVDPERIAARLRIEAEADADRLREAAAREPFVGRSRRQLATPKEISIQVTAPLFSSRLFEYGVSSGDEQLPNSLDVGKKITLRNPMKYYGQEYSTVYVLSNGAIGFDSSSRSYKAGIFSEGDKMIAPFWNRNDLRNGGHVWYREVTSGRVLERGQSEIRYQYDVQVRVRSALLVTWEQMQPLGAAPLPEDNTNTFQAAIFITDNGTFANFIYSNVGWTQGAEAGFNKADGSGEHFALPTSGTGNIMYLEEYGNTGIPGEWMFSLGDEAIIRCKSGIKGDTCDQECSTGEWGADCARCCHCSSGNCNAVNGQCQSGCSECWTGANCQTKKDNCRSKTLTCAVNALSFTDKDRCGEPIPRCQCLAGFTGDGRIRCEDVNECAKPGTCHEKATCTNTPGKFFCQCIDGYSGDGVHSCVASVLHSTDGHQTLPSKKNAKMIWQLRKPIKLFGEMRDKLTISSSGVLSLSEFDDSQTSSHLEDLHAMGIAAFYAPIDTSHGGQVDVAETQDPEELAQISQTVAEKFGENSFTANNALIVTYANVTDGRARRGNTFQTLLVSGTDSRGESQSFVELRYKDLPWSEGAEAGILSSDVINSVSLPGSGTQGIELLTQLSNVNQPGVWIYRVDDSVIPPCPQPNQQPPYCDDNQQSGGPTRSLTHKTTRRPSSTEAVQRGSSSNVGSETSGAFAGAPRFIQPSVVSGTVPVPSTPAARATERSREPTTTPRPRPAFNSTPHRPLVSVSDEDIDDIPPDAFEVTFPPFVTVIPEVFTSAKKRPMPDFSSSQPIQQSPPPLIPVVPAARPMLHADDDPTPKASPNIPIPSDNSIHASIKNSTGWAKEISPEDLLPTTAPAVQRTEITVTIKTPTIAPVDVMESTERAPSEEVEVKEEEVKKVAVAHNTLNANEDSASEDEEPATVTSTMTSPTITADTEKTNPIFVFTTTKATPRPTKKPSPKSRIVTAPSTSSIPDHPFQTPGEAEATASKLAVIIPTGIVAVWLLMLLIIALVVCCRKRNSAQRHRYGPSYAGGPVTSYNVKRSSKAYEGSYEDHLEKAARLSTETGAYNQNGRVSLYGSYWNLNNSPSSSQTSNPRHSPYLGYTQPTRHNYAGRY